MLIFELYRQLDIHMFQTFSVMDNVYGSCAKYILDSNSLILLGSDHSIHLNMIDKQITKDNAIRNWNLDSEAVLWFAEESVEAAVIRFINDAFRIWYGIDSGDAASNFVNSYQAINKLLASYDMKIYIDDSGMSIFKNDEALSFEEALRTIGDIDENRMDESGIEQLLNEAAYYKNIDRLDDASVRLEKVMRYMDPSLPYFATVIFSLAETYYFMGNYSRAVELYYRIKPESINNKEDFYLHLGHAILDERMKKYERQLRIFYHSKIDPMYADTHKPAVRAAATEIEEVFDEYEKTCLEMGRNKYEEHRNLVPDGSDDIDEILFSEDIGEEDGHKKYLDITLTEPTAVSSEISKLPSDLIAEALSKFLSGDYQEAFEIYYRLSQEVSSDSDYYTWVHLQLGKLYSIFDEPAKAQKALVKCTPSRFGLVYSEEDFFILLCHEHIVNDDFESDKRFRKLIRGRLDAYYAHYDKEYNMLIRDEQLMKAYSQYEEECYKNGRYYASHDMLIPITPTASERRGGGFGGNLKRFFKHK